MAKITDNLKILAATKEDIKNAIESKGQSLTSVPFTKYAEKILKITGGGVEDLDLVLDEQEAVVYDLERLFVGLPVDGSSMNDAVFNELYVKQNDLFVNLLTGEPVKEYTDEDMQDMTNIFINITQGEVHNA